MERQDIQEAILMFFRVESSEGDVSEIHDYVIRQGLLYSEQYIREQINRLEEKGLVSRQTEGKFVVFSR